MAKRLRQLSRRRNFLAHLDAGSLDELRCGHQQLGASYSGTDVVDEASEGSAVDDKGTSTDLGAHAGIISGTNSGTDSKDIFDASGDAGSRTHAGLAFSSAVTVGTMLSEATMKFESISSKEIEKPSAEEPFGKKAATSNAAMQSAAHRRRTRRLLWWFRWWWRRLL